MENKQNKEKSEGKAMSRRINSPLVRTTLAEALELAEQNSVSNQAEGGAKKSDSLKVSRKRFQALVDDRVRLRQQNKVLERENAVMGDDLLALRKRYGDLSAGFLEISECYFSLLGLLSQLTEIGNETGKLDQVYALVIKGAEAFFNDEAAPFPDILKKKVVNATGNVEELIKLEEELLKKELPEESLTEDVTGSEEEDDEIDYGEED